MGMEFLSKSVGQKNKLSSLIDSPQETHVGYIVRMQYDSVDILTNDFFKERVGGIPQNSFLLAASFDPEDFGNALDVDKVVLLLRVQEPVKLPQDDSNLVTIIEHLQGKEEITRADERDGIEPITHSLLQFGGLKCNCLGSFFLDDSGQLLLGADIEDFQSVAHLRVYKPTPGALSKIVNYIDPIRQRKTEEDSKALGFGAMPEPFSIGTVRYTSTNRLQKSNGTSEVVVTVQPTDFLARRTAVLGMTRTGKSNTIKTTVSAVALAAARAQVLVGQLIFDMNGEYANANGQDDGSSISEVFENNVVRYRGLDAKGFYDLRDNFYKSLENGLNLLQNALSDSVGSSVGQDLQGFLSLSLEEPDDPQKMNRWRKTVAIYKALLKESNFPHTKSDDVVKFSVGEQVLDQIFSEVFAEHAEEEGAPRKNRGDRVSYVKQKLGDPKLGLSLQQAVDFFKAVRDADRNIRESNSRSPGLESSTKGKSWLDPHDRSLLNLMAGKNDNDRPIRSTRVINSCGLAFHSSKGSENISRDIYSHLENGRIVIVDLSVGTQSVRENMSLQIARYVLDESFKRFTSNERQPPCVVIYVEEAHNLIGKNADFNTTWPRIAKEGAKAKISLVYATQEPSSVHPNILANTENFFVTHLNNDDELRALSKYYDFSDFSQSLKKSQDVGFARIKTLSSPFVVPSQILKFEPKILKQEYNSIAARPDFKPAPRPNEIEEF
ncbi:helicase HerA domain-containing protein [Hahella sp. HN01]|uniref:helicase HerA domain-containing protein n=1 Tax=Hahella sp. HN01 TaxID=2847262 RepID=UPI001C1EF45F|nr:DUF87 domain-containing protein [Hahella sp. HN01]MBU6952618.1 DUF87 domain-containing protein [Hahella sp. HN01]